MFKQAVDHILEPVDDYHLGMLRTASVCGVLTFVFIVVGINHLITLMLYLTITAVAVFSTWLLSLNREVRCDVVERVKFVFNDFWDRCVGDILEKRQIANKGVNTRKQSTSTGDREDDVNGKDDVSLSDSSDTIGKTDTEVNKVVAADIEALAEQMTSLF